MDQNLQQIFATPFYIDRQYAQSFTPLFFQFLKGNLKTSAMEGDDREQRLENLKSDSHTGTSQNYVAVISIKQPILKYDSYRYFGTKTYQGILDRIAGDPNALGVVLDIDSGGGSSYGTPEFYDYLLNYSKPIVTHTDGYLCSAAYYIGAPTDYIVANKRAEAIGSIGAYTTVLDLSGIIEHFGGKEHVFYSSKSSEKNAEIEEVFKGNYEPYIKNILDPLVDTFHADMKVARPGLDEKVFKGGVFSADKSLKFGLIDEIGTLQTAIDKVVELSEQNSNSNFNTDMSKEQTFPKLAAVLGVESVEAKKPHIFAASETVSLSVEQLSAIESALSDLGGSEKLTALQTALDAANAAKKVAEDNNTALQTSVTAAIEKAGLTAEKKATASENVDLLAEKVVEFGLKPGAEPTSVHSTGDPSIGIKETYSIFDSIVK